MVCKIGGSIVDGIDGSVIDDIRSLQNHGFRVVLVHGGGDQVTDVAEKLGKKQSFIKSPDGIRSRYTDRETAEIFTMVMSGLIAKRIVQTLQRNGINCVSLTGLDGSLLRADRKKKLIAVDDHGRKLAIEGGYTGKIRSVNTDYLSSLLDASIVPVISPVALGGEWELLNVDGDRACSHVAGSVGAESAVFLTDADGLILDGRLVDRMSASLARESLPKIGPGMDKKIIAAAEAVEMGAKRSVVASGLKKHPLQNALAGNGTVITSQG